MVNLFLKYNCLHGSFFMETAFHSSYELLKKNGKTAVSIPIQYNLFDQSIMHRNDWGTVEVSCTLQC